MGLVHFNTELVKNTALLLNCFQLLLEKVDLL